MFEALKGWILTIITAVFFITAVEMILPDNSLKKYAKFVLGLILITIFINPIIKLFDRNFDINTYTTNAVKNFDKNKCKSDFKEYQKKSMNNTLEVFTLNLQTSCQKKLKERYPQSDYKVKVDASYDEESKKLNIKDIKIGVKEGAIETIKKVSIGQESKVVNNTDAIDDEKSSSIKLYLSNELNLPKDLIYIYKL